MRGLEKVLLGSAEAPTEAEDHKFLGALICEPFLAVLSHPSIQTEKADG